MRVRPSRPGLLVGCPGRASYLAQGGEEVPRSAYWMRRLRKGDVVQVLEDAPSSPEPEPEPEPTPTTRPRRKKAASRRAGPQDENPES